MKISLFVPKEKKNIIKFIREELSQAKNIKSKKTRDDTVEGLSKLLDVVESGFCYFWDDKQIKFFPYDGKDFHYRCGRELSYPKGFLDKYQKYWFVVLDANNCDIAELRGKRLVTIWSAKSNVPRKQDSGGQSELRYEKNRAGALKQWFKKIANILKDNYYKR